MTRPEFVTDDLLEGLDALRDSGIIKMNCAGLYLEMDFGLSQRDAGTALAYWEHTHSEHQTMNDE